MHERERAKAITSEKAILVRLIQAHEKSAVDPLDELAGLAKTAGAIVVAEMTQRREKPDAGAYLGKGKVEELNQLVEHHAADVVIFDNDLSPGQVRNLEQATGVKVIDRTELILDIFATHAQTYESRLAVELAQLEYALPRLKRMWTHLSRIKMGVGMRGPGEKQLEVDRRLVEKRINDLRTELREIEKRKERQVAGRRGFLAVSLVGYTNAGKSTLMNALTDAHVKAEDKLFATLDTRTRRWQLPNWGPVLLSDTVGFIRDLPHRLVTSFKATLEETRQADLLLHVADASSPAVLDQISAVFSVLEEIGIEEKDTLLLLNKIDDLDRAQFDHALPLERILSRYPNAIPISAKTREGFERLAKTVSDALSRSFRELSIETSVSNGKLMAYLAAHGEILSRNYQDDRVVISCRLPQKYLGRIHDPNTVIHDLTSAVPTEPDYLQRPPDKDETVSEFTAPGRASGRALGKADDDFEFEIDFEIEPMDSGDSKDQDVEDVA